MAARVSSHVETPYSQGIASRVISTAFHDKADVEVYHLEGCSGREKTQEFLREFYEWLLELGKCLPILR